MILSIDLAEVCRKVWDAHGRTPGELFDTMTPAQFVAVFFKPTGSNQLDRVAAVGKVNHERAAKKQRPIIPTWM